MTDEQMTDELNQNDETLVIADEVFVSGKLVNELVGDELLSFNDVITAIDGLAVSNSRQLKLIYDAIQGQSKSANFQLLKFDERKQAALTAANTAILRDEKRAIAQRKSISTSTSEHNPENYQLTENNKSSAINHVEKSTEKATSVNKLEGLSLNSAKPLSPLEMAKMTNSGSTSNQVSIATPEPKVNVIKQSDETRENTSDSKETSSLESAISKFESTSSKQASFYRDNAGRLRHSSGRYATKDETRSGKYQQGKFPLSSFASVIKNPMVGKMVFGGAYEVIEEISELKGTISSAFVSRGIIDTKTAKQYASEKLASTKESLGINTRKTVKVENDDTKSLLSEVRKNETSEKERHVAEQLKTDQLITQIGDIPAGGSGGGGMLEEVAADFLDPDAKRNRNRNRRRKGGRRFGRFGLPDFGSESSSRTNPNSGKGAIGKYSSKLAGAGSALTKVGSVAGKAMPWVAAAVAVNDAYDGFTDKTKQQEAFNLQRGQEAFTGQKASLGVANALNLGGLVSGASGLLGSGLGALGFEGAKDALTFDETDMAKSIYQKGTSISSGFSNIYEGLLSLNFSQIGQGGSELLKNISPAALFASSLEQFNQQKNPEKAEESAKSNAVANIESMVKAASYIPVNNNAPVALTIPEKANVTSSQDNKGTTKIINDNEAVVSVLNEIKKQLEKQNNTSTSITNNVDRRTTRTTNRVDIPTEFSDPYLAGMAHDRD